MVKVPYPPWVAEFSIEGVPMVKRFVKLTEALKWIDEPDETLGYSDPEWSASVMLVYDPKPDWEDNQDPDMLMGLIGGRVVAKVIDAWAGGGANYRLEIEQPSYRQAFWLGEGDFILFDAGDL